jgi:hypothetical protein
MDSPALLIALAGLVLAFGGLLFLTPRMLKDQKQKSVTKGGLEFSCPACQQMVFVTRQSLKSLIGVEAALVIQNVPDAPMYNLGEQRCQACSTSLTFRTDCWPPAFLIANAIEKTKVGNTCVECRGLLARPTWPRGIYDRKIDEIPDRNPKLGLKCPRCDAVSCVACLESVTRNRTPDGSFLCPRCFRSPVDLVHHF